METVATSFYMSTTAGCCYPMAKLGRAPNHGDRPQEVRGRQPHPLSGSGTSSRFPLCRLRLLQRPATVRAHPETIESGTLLCLCRWYTASQLAHREDAEVAVQMVCAAQGSGDVMLVMFITKASITLESFLLSIRACRAVVSTWLV